MNDKEGNRPMTDDDPVLHRVGMPKLDYYMRGRVWLVIGSLLLSFWGTLLGMVWWFFRD